MAQRVMSLATIPWMVVVVVGALCFMSGMLNAVWALWPREETRILAFPVGLLAVLLLWPLVLEIAWLLRRAWLRGRTKPITATVVGSDYRTRRISEFTTVHELRIEVEFVHPETAETRRSRKVFVFRRWRGKWMREFRDRFAVGAAMPLRVRRRIVAFDLRQRPGWADIW